MRTTSTPLPDEPMLADSIVDDRANDDRSTADHNNAGRVDAHRDEALDYNYRALSPAAVGALVLGLLSVTAFIDWWLLVIPVAGLALSMRALVHTRRYAAELTGRGMAILAMSLSLVCLVGGAGWLSYVYASELREGEVRLSYDDLQPDERIMGQIIPPDVEKFHEQRVLLKGYALAGLRKEGIATFILVRDKGDCCFGGNPKLTDRVLVKLKPGVRLTYSDRLQKIAGLFRVQPGSAVDVAGQVVYQLEDAELR